MYCELSPNRLAEPALVGILIVIRNLTLRASVCFFISVINTLIISQVESTSLGGFFVKQSPQKDLG